MAWAELVANTRNKTIACNRIGKPRSHKCVDIIKRDVKETRWEGVGWIEVSQDVVQQRAVANTALNFCFQNRTRNVAPFNPEAAQLAASQGELSSMERLPEEDPCSVGWGGGGGGGAVGKRLAL
jgi:hypothetical protein